MNGKISRYVWITAGLFAFAIILGCASQADKYSMGEAPGEDYYLTDETETYGDYDDGVGGGYVDAPDVMKHKSGLADVEYEEAAEEAYEEEPPTYDTTTTTGPERDLTGDETFGTSGKKTEKLMIIKEADLSFEVKKVEDTSNEILAIASKYNAIIVDSHKYKDDDGHGFATTTIRVEPQYFEKLIADFKGIEGGDLVNEQISGTDVTKEYIDLKARLKNKKEVEAQYTELLKRSGTIPDIMAVQREMERVREEIERLEGEIRYYENRVGLSTVTVNLSEPSVSVPGSRSFGDDMKDAFRTMIAICIFFIQAIIVLLPFIIILLIILLIIRIIIKMRKAAQGKS
ncbi:MAG: DUF4349 domain-containing protein [bacterium]|nr:DUF4349 domain-containing protein [bacterium]